MNRVDFQNLAGERLADAAALLAAGRFDCAYYIAGYTNRVRAESVHC
ncbi:MAG: hypothetical protein ABSH09_29410 [Bryobacteraceae bacterium]